MPCRTDVDAVRSSVYDERLRRQAPVHPRDFRPEQLGAPIDPVNAKDPNMTRVLNHSPTEFVSRDNAGAPVRDIPDVTEGLK
jgi:hypothetical protein